jgi:hypothetical protein
MAIIDPLFSILDRRECNRATLACSVWLIVNGSTITHKLSALCELRASLVD